MIQDAYESYNKQRKAERKYLESIIDIKSVEEGKKYLEQLAKFQEQTYIDFSGGGDSKGFWNFLNNTLTVGNDGLYENELRFLYELIQNVDDCRYAKAEDARLYVDFNFVKNTITLSYNEVGFTTNNVFGITNIAATTKNKGLTKEIEIGEKGIGFKSVFGVADKVLIQSKYFSFSLSKENFIVPVLEYDNYDYVDGTKMTLYLKKGKVKGIYREFLKQYNDLGTDLAPYLKNNPILFLNKLTTIVFHNEFKQYCKFAISRKDLNINDELVVEDDVKLIIEKGDDYRIPHDTYECDFYRFTKPVIYDKEACVSRYKDNCPFEEKKHKIIALAIKGDSKNLKPFSFDLGMMYSFLPTAIKTNVPMIFHIPFKLDMSREGIDNQGNNKWFRHTVEQLRVFVKEIYYKLRELEEDNLIYYLPKIANNNIFKCRDNQNQKIFESNAFSMTRIEGLDATGTEWNETLADYDIVPAVGGGYISVNDAYYSKDVDTEVFSEIVDLLYPGKGVIKFRLKSDFSKYNVKKIDEGEMYCELFKKMIFDSTVTSRITEIFSKLKYEKYSKYIDVLNIFNSERINLTSNQVMFMMSSEGISKILENCLLSNPEQSFNPLFSIIDDEIYKLSVEDNETLIVKESLSFYKGQKNVGFIDEFCDLEFVKLQNVPNDFIFVTDKQFFYSDLVKNILKLFDILNKKVDDSNSKLKDIVSWLRVDINRLSFKHKLANYQYEDPARFINELYECNRITKNLTGEYYKKMLAQIENSLSNPEKFIYEIIQNADDCEYLEEPEFTLDVEDSRMIIKYNETGFTQENLRALTDIGFSSKTNKKVDNELIGEKGVGFKSIFKLAKSVDIHSGVYHFRLHDDEPTLPELIDGINEKGTKLIIDLKEKINTRAKDPNILGLCLCLRKIRKLTLAGWKIKIEDDELTRKVIVNNDESEFYKFSSKYKMSSELLTARQKTKSNVNAEQQVVAYIPKNLKHKNSGVLYCGLPTMTKMNIPVNIDANFELNTSRESLINNEWNQRLLDCSAELLKKAIHSLKSELGINVLKLIVEGDLCSQNCFVDFNVNDIKNEKIIKSIDGSTWLAPSETIVLYPVERIIIEKYNDRTRYKSYAAFDNSAGHREKLSKLGAKFISFNETLRNLKIKHNIEERIHDDKVYKAFYSMIQQECKNNSFYLNEEMRAIFKNNKLVPILLEGNESAFTCFDNDIIFKSIDKKYTSVKGIYYILDENKLSCSEYCSIFQRELKEFNDEYANKFEIEILKKYLDIEDDEERANKFYGIYKRNKKNFKNFISYFDLMELQRIPLLLRSGEYGYNYNSYIYENETNFINEIIIEDEWCDFAKIIGAKSLKEESECYQFEKFLSDEMFVKELLLVEFEDSKSMWLSVLDSDYIKFYVIVEWFFEIYDIADFIPEDINKIEFREKIIKQIDLDNDDIDLINILSVRCSQKIMFAIPKLIKKSPIDKDYLIDLVNDIVERECLNVEGIKEWITSNNIYYSDLDETLFINQKIGKNIYLRNSIKTDAEILEEIERLLYLITGRKTKVKRDMKAYDRTLANKINCNIYSEKDIRYILKNNFKFDYLNISSGKEEIKKYLCDPHIVNRRVFGGYAKRCPLCGARVHTELTGFRLYKLVQEHIYEGKLVKYEFVILCCQNCFDGLVYCDEYWINVDRWLEKQELEIRVTLNDEIWEPIVFKPKIAHQALLIKCNERYME